MWTNWLKETPLNLLCSSFCPKFLRRILEASKCFRSVLAEATIFPVFFSRSNYHLRFERIKWLRVARRHVSTPVSQVSVGALEGHFHPLCVTHPAVRTGSEGVPTLAIVSHPPPPEIFRLRAGPGPGVNCNQTIPCRGGPPLPGGRDADRPGTPRERAGPGPLPPATKPAQNK